MEKGKIINNRYEIVSRVGAGGMSDVYKAKDHKLNRNVAIKVLKKEFSTDTNFVSKFKTEAQSAARLIHPNIVNVYDVGEEDGLHYIVMELIEGITLKQYIQKKGQLSVRETISIAIQIANGIECAHNNQLVHRDIKPQNIMISREGKVKVTDFGIARAASSNTINGTAMGSVHYISPEQAASKYVDEKTDIYSLGITIYEMLTGKVPFDGESTVSIALKHIQSRVPSVKELIPNIPISIEKIVLKCTQNKTEMRYPKISLLIADLKRALSEPNVDFVQLDQEPASGSTVIISDVKKVVDTLDNEKEEEKRVLDDDIDVVPPKMDKIITVGGVVVGILALIIVAVVITSILMGNNIKISMISKSEESETIDPYKTIVPNVVGLTEDEAEVALRNQNLRWQYNERVYSDEYAYGCIVMQSETAGDIVEKNTEVILTVSNGAEKVKIPDDLVGENVDEVTARLEEMGLKWEITYEHSGEEIGTVISTMPNAGGEADKYYTVKLTVSRGSQSKDEEIFSVPNVVDKTEAKAQQALSDAGFNIGEVRYQFSNDYKKGNVIRQTIKSGTKAPEGTTIGLVVSQGPENAAVYTGTYTFSKEDLLDASGNPITTGAVSVKLDGVAQDIDATYANVETWPGDFTITVTGPNEGKATIELAIDNVIIRTDTVKLK